MSNPDQKASELQQAALDYHRQDPPGKIKVVPTKPLVTQRDLALAYSPGVAFACEAIVADPNAASEMTARGNLVAVITNGTAVLGLGDIGPLAGKPVMEGKGVLFQKFAGKLALADVFALQPMFDAGAIAAPRYLPPWMQRANGLAGMLAFSLFANRIRLDRVDADDLVLGLGV